ncbi:allophanate hydrolase [Salipiger aestuarii]|uniref:KipI family sensor histidine kinase inhibitor n=1 Tax=Salipiger aestuarii TaxID=568098 RepID=A0A327Y2Z9_9RHOB|nr:carboxyltransferase domain-containing protein [Salipiger aestuarii]KAA8606284.1 allophanate hydrolase [Salipiger aestuarii]KAA8609397.1 allophanate hydrolase [Salipiger aestuarii]KAB2540936.1 allophanate hydrolase [Salipiger aestuarii]RAK12799.1 KipI family sensor histidine kinase inhibitor [Salipiger aestuarii]
MALDGAIFPIIRTVGVDGMLVSFGDRLSEPANRAAIAFRAELDAQGWDGIEESSSSLVSCYVRFDPLYLSHAALRTRLDALMSERDWLGADLPHGRWLHRIPTVYGGKLAPQLGEAAAAAGLSESEAIASLSETRVRVTALGFSPGQPYLGELPECWDIPRQQALTPKVPKGALVVAIRQLVLFGVTAPTGWRHVGQTAATLFRVEAERPFLLAPGDEVVFAPIDEAAFENMRHVPGGGVHSEMLA